MVGAIKIEWAARSIHTAPWVNGSRSGDSSQTPMIYRIFREELRTRRGRWAWWPYPLFRRKTAEDTAWSINSGNRRSFPSEEFEARVDFETGGLWVRARPQRGDALVEAEEVVLPEPSWVDLSPRKKITHPYQGLTTTQRSNIRHSLRDGQSPRSLAIKYGVTIKTINKIGEKS